MIGEKVTLGERGILFEIPKSEKNTVFGGTAMLSFSSVPSGEAGERILAKGPIALDYAEGTMPHGTGEGTAEPVQPNSGKGAELNDGMAVQPVRMAVTVFSSMLPLWFLLLPSVPAISLVITYVGNGRISN